MVCNQLKGIIMLIYQEARDVLVDLSKQACFLYNFSIDGMNLR